MESITFQLENFCDLCDECDHYHHTPERLYLRNGDPGYPAEDDCDKDFKCDQMECREEYDEDALECRSCSVGYDECPFKEEEEINV